MTNFYSKLQDKRNAPIGEGNWIGNLRHYAMESKIPLEYTFAAVPSALEDGQYENGQYDLQRLLYGIKVVTAGSMTDFVYGADYLSVKSATEDVKISFPWENYGIIIDGRLGDDSYIEITDSANSGRKTKDTVVITYEISDKTVLIKDEDYYISIRCNGDFTKNNGKLRFLPTNGRIQISISFHKNLQKASDESRDLFFEKDAVLEKSRTHWEEYLESCPVIRLEEPVVYKNEFADIEESYSPEDVLTRELWHWWCVLINVNTIEFNKLDTYIAPDKPIWKGTWSNDGPESMSLLSLTNQKNLVRECIVNYISTAINKDGVHSWYTHSNGTGCYGNTGDSGRLSHGVPNIMHTVEFYVRQTGDVSILDCDAKDKMTVWEKISRYAYEIFKSRDINNDNLIEWVNLWETGWDDKNCPFFEKKDLMEWMEAVTTLPQDELDMFYSQNNRPITSVVEQVYILWGLKSIANLAKIKNDRNLLQFCENQFDKTKKSVKDKMWSEENGFYFDIDVKNNSLSKSKSSDAFYFLYFEDDKNRINKIMEHMNNKNEFRLFYLPTASFDSKGFRQDGYWNGGHWPREMSYVGLALNKCGRKDEAVTTVVRAIMSDKGCVIAENMDSVTGIRKTHSTKMAYTALLNVALLECFGKIEWSV